MTTTPDLAVTVAYTAEYLDWRLGDGHPTNPERARIAVDMVTTWAANGGVPVRSLTPQLDLDRAMAAAGMVHSPTYLDRFAAGSCEEWSGRQERLRDVATLMFTGTMDLVEDLLTHGGPGVWFNPQGAKHHAHADHASGFCVLNDMAWAAHHLTSQGRKVVYVDWDAHHGDGVEALLFGDTRAVTASIHDATIFPGTGHTSFPAAGAYNWPLARGAGDTDLAHAMHDVLALLEAEDPDVLLVACGADGLAGDPLSTLTYTLSGIQSAAAVVGGWAATHQVPVLVGGAGGYQPLTETPTAWALTIRSLHDAFSSVPGETIAC